MTLARVRDTFEAIESLQAHIVHVYTTIAEKLNACFFRPWDLFKPHPCAGTDRSVLWRGRCIFEVQISVNVLVAWTVHRQAS